MSGSLQKIGDFFRVVSGVPIDDTVQEAIALARINNTVVAFTFGDHLVIVEPNSDPEDILRYYWERT